MKKSNAFSRVGKLTLVVLLLIIIFTPFTIVNAGERGVLMQFGKVQRVLGEGIHPIIPLVNTVKKLSVRVQKQDISTQASSKDLQDVFTNVALNWHIIPEEADIVFQQIGAETEVVDRIINPAVEEVLKAVMAKYTAEEIITKRSEVKSGVDKLLTARITNYHLAIDDVSLVHIHFSKRFNEAVEAKQIAEQQAKQTSFLAQKATKEAEVKVNLAKGEAEAQRLLRENLTPEILLKQAIDKWNGDLPVVFGNDSAKLLDLRELFIGRSK
ncbi:prohibitin family protein [Argonema antarcticum]|uniref:prohibitin family protein n=1 Tax=Argonema antarcticum TaxID=2942763 RepID=UPI002012DE67|nr:prohibitin family protein [Argonema antarcticum]MCL1469623.1 prohibitin family protein [Argonema antarcticum A004/B2]